MLQSLRVRLTPHEKLPPRVNEFEIAVDASLSAMSQPMQLDAPPAQSGRSSSPLVFPSSSALLSDPAPGQPQSALFNVPSSAASAPRGQLQSVRGSSPLFFPA